VERRDKPKGENWEGRKGWQEGGEEQVTKTANLLLSSSEEKKIRKGHGLGVGSDGGKICLGNYLGRN